MISVYSCSRITETWEFPGTFLMWKYYPRYFPFKKKKTNISPIGCLARATHLLVGNIIKIENVKKCIKTMINIVTHIKCKSKLLGHFRNFQKQYQNCSKHLLFFLVPPGYAIPWRMNFYCLQSLINANQVFKIWHLWMEIIWD